MNFIGFTDLMATVRVFSRVKTVDALDRWASAARAIRPEFSIQQAQDQKAKHEQGLCLSDETV